MYKFVEALDDNTYAYLRKKFGYAESSDTSPIVGWVLDEKQVGELMQIKELTFKVFDIPEEFQDDITEFKTQYWDGDFVFDDDNYCFMKEKGSDEMIFPGRIHWPGPKEYYFEDEKERMI